MTTPATTMRTEKRNRETPKKSHNFSLLLSESVPSKRHKPNPLIIPATVVSVSDMIQVWINPEIPNFGSPLCGYLIPQSVYTIINICNPRVTKTESWRDVFRRQSKSSANHRNSTNLGDAKALLSGMFDVYLQSSDLLNRTSKVNILTDILVGWRYKLSIAERLLTPPKTDPKQRLSWFEWQAYMIDMTPRPCDITEEMMKEATDKLCNPVESIKIHVDHLYSAVEYIKEIKIQLKKIWHSKNLILKNMIYDKNQKKILLGFLWCKDKPCRLVAEKVAKKFRSAQLRQYFQHHHHQHKTQNHSQFYL